MPQTVFTPVKRDTRTRRLTRYMTNPYRIVAGVPIAIIVALLDNHWHLSWNTFWPAYLTYIPAIFLIFWLSELHHWAGGSRYNRD